MKDLLILIVEIATFFALHSKTSFMDEYPYGWRENTARVAGVMFTLPFFILFFVISQDKPLDRAIKSFILAFFGSGLGTGLGWMVDGL